VEVRGSIKKQTITRFCERAERYSVTALSRTDPSDVTWSPSAPPLKTPLLAIVASLAIRRSGGSSLGESAPPGDKTNFDASALKGEVDRMICRPWLEHSMAQFILTALQVFFYHVDHPILFSFAFLENWSLQPEGRGLFCGNRFPP